MAEEKGQLTDTGKEEDNVWASVLSEVQTSRTSQLPSSQNLLVLGDRESGKTALVAKLQGNEGTKNGACLEYGYIDVWDEYKDDHTRLGHWYYMGIILIYCVLPLINPISPIPLCCFVLLSRLLGI